MNVKAFFQLIKDAAAEWRASRASNLAAAMAYYAMFALAPLLIVAINVAERLFGSRAVAGELAVQIGDWIGPEAATLIESALAATANRPGSTALAAALSALTLWWAATNLLRHLQRALGALWGADMPPERRLLYAVRNRLLALIIIAGIGMLLGLSVAMLSAIIGLKDWLRGFFPNFVRFAPLIDLGTSALLLTMVCAVVYRTLPNVQLDWRDVGVGAIVTAFMLTASKYVISLYLGYSSVQSAYGAAGSLVVLLIWVYYSSQVFLYGAAFTKVYAQRYGSQIAHRKPPLPAVAIVASGEEMPAWPALAATDNSQATQLGARFSARAWLGMGLFFLAGWWIGGRRV